MKAQNLSIHSNPRWEKLAIRWSNPPKSLFKINYRDTTFNENLNITGMATIIKNHQRHIVFTAIKRKLAMSPLAVKKKAFYWECYVLIKSVMTVALWKLTLSCYLKHFMRTMIICEKLILKLTQLRDNVFCSLDLVFLFVKRSENKLAH